MCLHFLVGLVGYGKVMGLQVLLFPVAFSRTLQGRSVTQEVSFYVRLPYRARLSVSRFLSLEPAQELAS